MAHPQKPAGPAPTRASLNESALRHLGRYAATEAALVRVLDRRVLRWGQRAASEGVEVEEAMAVGRDLVRDVVRALVAAGAVNDQAFAEARAARLVKAGRSRRAVVAHLAARGIPADAVEGILADVVDEVPSALAYARRRRIGPFRSSPGEGDFLRDMGALGRAGFSRETAHRALTLPIEEAEVLVIALKRG